MEKNSIDNGKLHFEWLQKQIFDLLWKYVSEEKKEWHWILATYTFFSTTHRAIGQINL